VDWELLQRWRSVRIIALRSGWHFGNLKCQKFMVRRVGCGMSEFTGGVALKFSVRPVFGRQIWLILMRQVFEK